ncbi:MAG: MFS transporter [Coxiellaceae bacterium]|jgi:OPA family glycerol-3-phosphate transporter-like MFS transporter|nr:MFS transporter [Coxiellaceae bacterium]
MYNFFRIFHPAPHIDRIPQEKIKVCYDKMRLQVFSGLFIGYAACCLLRNNISLAIPYLVEQQGFNKTYLGSVLAALPLGYGLSKFFMATIADRSNPRYFIATGLLLAAVFNTICGVKIEIFHNFFLICAITFLNGWFQGMIWPASARAMTHWFAKKERGTIMSIWGLAHNLGTGGVALLVTFGIALFSFWHYGVFYFPSIICLIGAIIVLLTVRDTPQSEGLPSIEEYKEDSVESSFHKIEKELTVKEILFKYVLVNKYLWYLAAANIFVYLVRFGAHNWTPLYLTQIKGFTHDSSRLAFMLYELAAIPGTLLFGWISDRIGGKRAPICIGCMIASAISIACYWFAPFNALLYNNISLMAIGFFIHAPMVLIGVYALDLSHKKAAGTAAGLTGLFGYVGGTILANAGLGYVTDYFGWIGSFVLLIISCVLASLFLILTLNANTEQTIKCEKKL